MEHFLRAAREFEPQIDAIRRDESLPDGRLWYPYSTLANAHHFDNLLTGANRSIFDNLEGAKVADIGGADAHFSFLFEQLGAHVDLIDYGPTNMNHLEGAKYLKRKFASDLSIFEMDIDDQFSLPREYDMAIFLGILYHLKNPFYVLEKLAKSVSHAFISTRISKHSAKLGSLGSTNIRDLPVAYLLSPDESNNDATNYWIFSEAGLRRIIDRAGWEIADWLVVGNEESYPQEWEGDQRAFCYLKSKVKT